MNIDSYKNITYDHIMLLSFSYMKEKGIVIIGDIISFYNKGFENFSMKNWNSLTFTIMIAVSLNILSEIYDMFIYNIRKTLFIFLLSIFQYLLYKLYEKNKREMVID